MGTSGNGGMLAATRRTRTSATLRRTLDRLARQREDGADVAQITQTMAQADTLRHRLTTRQGLVK